MMSGDNRLKHARLLIEQNKLTQARKIAVELLSENPSEAEILFELGRIDFYLGKHLESLKILESAIERDPTDGYHFLYKARCLMALNQLAEAEIYLKKAIELSPDAAHFFMFYAELRLLQNRSEESLEFSKIAIASNPENWGTWHFYVRALLDLKRYPEAKVAIDEALRINPNDDVAHANLGIYYFETLDYPEAKESFKIALSIDPESKMAQQGLLQVLRVEKWILRLFAIIEKKGEEKNRNYFMWFGIIAAVLFRITAEIGKRLPESTGMVFLIWIFFGIVFSLIITAHPIAELVLRFDKFGVLLMDKAQKKNAVAVGFAIILSMTGLILSFVNGEILYLSVFVLGYLMTLPASLFFLDHSFAQRTKSKFIILTLFSFGAVASYMMIRELDYYRLIAILFGLAYYGFIHYANVLRTEFANEQ
jgi:tetratricopeptide (TPR) repeat protein